MHIPMTKYHNYIKVYIVHTHHPKSILVLLNDPSLLYFIPGNH